MNMRKIDRAAYIIIIVFFILTTGACGTSQSDTQASSTHARNGQSTPTSTPTSAPTPTPIPSPTPTPTSIVGLQGPKDFVLNNTLHFSDASGTGIVNGVTTQLSSDTVEQGVTQNLQHTLFVVDSNLNVTVYTNTSTTPIQAQVSQNADGSTNIQYTHASQAGSTTFSGTLTGDQMKATYSGEFMAGATVNGQSFSGGTDSTATFTTQVNWVSPDQIPAPPTNARYQLTGDGGVALSWSPGSPGGTVKRYNIYRFVLLDKRGFQLIGNTSGTSYPDESPAARSNAQTIAGIAYDIYAVGPTGIENPIPAVVSISSLG